MSLTSSKAARVLRFIQPEFLDETEKRKYLKGLTTRRPLKQQFDFEAPSEVISSRNSQTIYRSLLNEVDGS
jgi:hypothetical protein